MSTSYKIIPTWDEGDWTTTVFNTKEEYIEFLLPLFKIPGEYKFDESSFIFNEQARFFRDRGFYCDQPSGGKDYRLYWDDQKHKCRVGIIVKNNGNTWHIPRDYYMWLNFLQVNDKEQKKFDFVQIRDAQYHMALYELLAELHGQNVAICKKRQIASSYYHCAKLINILWFEETPILKIGASEKKFVNEQADWKFLDEYRNFLNAHTAWYRPMNPDKIGIWQQQIEVTNNNRKTKEGMKGVLQALTFDKDPEAGIGGPCHRGGTLILMSSGVFKKVEDIKVGDFVLGIDNRPKKVLRKFNGVDDMYKIDQVRGLDYYTTGDHLLYLINRDKNVAEQNKARLTKTKDWCKLSTYRKRCYVGVKNKKPLVFHNDYETPEIDPYFIGLWLGDGYRAQVGFIVNKTRDEEILNYLYNFSTEYNCPISVKRKEKIRYKEEMYTVRFAVSHKIHEDTFVTKEFVKYNLFYNKHIPDSFLYGSVEVRSQLLAGLIDTDGYYDAQKGRFIVTSVVKKLADQIAFLCRSLGGYVRQSTACSREHVLDGATIKFTETNVVSVSFVDPSCIPTKLKRKREITQRNNRSIHTSPINSITNVGKEEYFGIEVQDNLYYLEDLTLAHNCSLFFYDEGGNAPTADITYRYMKPAMRSGNLITGMFIIAGSVGELDKAEPLKKFLLNPEANGFYAVDSNLIDSKGTFGRTALFIPEQWSMLPFIDEYGNSDVESALTSLTEEFVRLERDLTPSEYQLEKSQRPRNIEEAFAFRKESLFPTHLLAAQKRRIELKTYPYELVDIYKNTEGKITYKQSNKLPIREFPLSKKTENKEGCIVMWERPVENPTFQSYYASIDPVSEGKSVTSESLCSIFIYKNDVEVTRVEKGQSKTFIEHGRIVAAWCGRFDDLNKTHERLELMIELYNAWTVVENNIAHFILHMISKHKQKYLVPKSELLFLKDLGANTNVYQEYGWKNTGILFKKHLLSYGIEYLKEEIDQEFKSDGEVVRTTYGVERIPDPMLIAEMEAYTDNVNVDRMVAYCALIAFVKVQQANRGFKKRVDHVGTAPKKDPNLYKRNTDMFRHLGKGNNPSDNQRPDRNPFKNLR